MRRTMHALFALAVLASSASAQSESPEVVSIGIPSSGCAPCSSLQQPAFGCGNGTGSQLAAYMNSFPTHPNLWASYPQEYQAKMDHLFRHVNGCNCLDPKRNLHAHPSVIGAKVHDVCHVSGCEPTAVPTPAAIAPATPSADQAAPQPAAKPASIFQGESLLKGFGKWKQAMPRVASTQAPGQPAPTSPSNSGVSVTPLR
ncbi:MAG: hypothetical protein ACK6DC_12410 [Planctomycetota bacterium]|jgi:hypothetical protein